MPRVIWHFSLDGEDHTMQLHHGYLSGKRMISLDGELIDRSFRLLDLGSVHRFQIGNHIYSIYIRAGEPWGLRFDYQLIVDGDLIEPQGHPGKSRRSEAIRGFALVGALGVLLALVLLWLPSLLDSVPLVVSGAMTCVLGPLAELVAGLLAVLALVLFCRDLQASSLHWVMFALSALIFVLYALFWAGDGRQTVGIMPALLLGFPVWIATIPVLSIAGMLVLTFLRWGKAFVLVPIGFALMILTVSAFRATAPLMEVNGLHYGWGARLAPLVSIAYVFLAVVMLARDEQDAPLEAWHARLVHLGSYEHYRKLHTLAKQHQWQITGPGGEAGLGVEVQGIWRDYAFLIASDSRVLFVALRAYGHFWRMPLDTRERLSSDGVEDTRTAERIVDAQGNLRPFLLCPLDDTLVPSISIASLREALTAGKRFLSGNAELATSEDVLYYRRPKLFWIRQDADSIPAVLDWLVGICQVMEAEGMVVSPEPCNED